MTVLVIFILISACIYLLCNLHDLQQKFHIKIEQDKDQIEQNDNLRRIGESLNLQNQNLENNRQKMQAWLDGLESSINSQESILESLTSTIQTMRDNARSQAEEAFLEKQQELTLVYEQQEQAYRDKYNKVVSILNKQILKEQNKLEDLEAKQKAFYEAQRRAQEMEEKKNFYKMNLSEFDLNDIHLLRELQLNFSKKDVIDKMIWESYYRPAYDILTGKILPGATKVSGIYKITSLLNSQAYIGQSVDCKERIRQHIKSAISANTSPSTNKLYSEMCKQGPENFTFEILEQVPRDKLNEREVYWIEFYKTKEIGLNSTKGGA